MPKPPTNPLSRLNQRLSERIPKTVVKKLRTDRAKAVMAIWDSVPKPSQTFPTEELQAAYLAGVRDERTCQMEYDRLLRDAGLR